MPLNLHAIEEELKKRWPYPYTWGRKQSDAWDAQTNFIYKTPSFDGLLRQTELMPPPIKNYAMNRWYNFWSAQAVEAIFCSFPTVKPNLNPYHKLIDFRINGIAFDHKTTVFPRAFSPQRRHGVTPAEYAKQHPAALARWLYENQSQQGRKHLENRLFIVLLHKSGEHWKLKAEISLLKETIGNYISSFHEKALILLPIQGKTVRTDILWVEQ